MIDIVIDLNSSYFRSLSSVDKLMQIKWPNIWFYLSQTNNGYQKVVSKYISWLFPYRIVDLTGVDEERNWKVKYGSGFLNVYISHNRWLELTVGKVERSEQRRKERSEMTFMMTSEHRTSRTSPRKCLLIVRYICRFCGCHHTIFTDCFPDGHSMRLSDLLGT